MTRALDVAFCFRFSNMAKTKLTLQVRKTLLQRESYRNC